MINYVYNDRTNLYGYSNSVSNNYAANLPSAQAATVTTVSNCTCSCEPQGSTGQFLNQYQFLMKGLSGAADKLRSLNTNGLWSDYIVQSSDTSAVEVSARYKLRSKDTYDMNVTQLAQSQVTTSMGVAGGDTAVIDGQFKINLPNQEGSIEVNVETAGRTNREVQGDIASQISQAGKGLTATVVEEDGESFLKIESRTGASNAFTIEGSTDFTTTKNAQNLEFTLAKNGVPMNDGNVYRRSENDNVMIDNGLISANVKKVGNMQIKVTADSEAIIKATEDFVNQYNKTLEFLVNNAHRGTGTAQTLDNLVRAPVSPISMKSIGITREANGRFTFDKKKFEQALMDNPDKVYDVLSDNYSIADGVYQDAQRGLGMSAEQLTNREIKTVTHHFVITQPFYGYNSFGMTSNIYRQPFFLNTLR